MSHSPRTPPSSPGGDKHRRVLAALALLSLALAWFWMAEISSHSPWYRNSDMNVHNIADALSLNSGYEPGVVDQPAATTKFFLAFDYRVRNEFGQLPVWTVKRFARATEPLSEFPRLVQAGRSHSRMLVIAFILLSALFVGHVTQKFDAACLAIVLLCGSSGLLFHGLLLRPELLCAGFGGVLMVHFVWLATTTSHTSRRAWWLLAAGVCGGLSLLSKLPALGYLVLACGWCWIAPWLGHPSDEHAPATHSNRIWTAAFGLLAALSIFAVLIWADVHRDKVDDVALARLRAAAVITALLPMSILFVRDGPVRRFLVERGLDTALLLGGVLLSFVAWFGLLRTVLPTDAAAGYMGKILNAIVHPEPLFALMTRVGESHRAREAVKFLLETPALILGTVVLAIFLASLRPIPLRLRALVLLLLVQALGLLLMMSKRQFLAQYSVFIQVPLLLIWAIGASMVQDWWRQRGNGDAPRWPMAVFATAALFLVLTVSVALAPKYKGFQDDEARPVRELTVTFFYDHDVHPPAYLEAMKKHFPTRQQFAETLNRYLENPDRRR